MVPALIESIKELGLVLVADTSAQSNASDRTEDAAHEKTFRIPDGVNGVMKGNGVLRFHETIDM